LKLEGKQDEGWRGERVKGSKDEGVKE
jgi:hypothetical protein